MSAQKIGMLLGTADFKPLVEKARRLTELQAWYLGSMPRPLTRASRVVGCRSGVLVLAADNAAVAAKLRQLTPRLLKQLSEQERQVTAIRIRVQPVNVPPPAELKDQRGLPAAALQHFETLVDTVGDPALKSAVETLVRHHRKRRRTAP